MNSDSPLRHEACGQPELAVTQSMAIDHTGPAVRSAVDENCVGLGDVCVTCPQIAIQSAHPTRELQYLQAFCELIWAPQKGSKTLLLFLRCSLLEQD